MRAFVSLALVASLLGVGPIASAHSSSVTYSTVELGAEGRVRYELRLATTDLNEVLSLPRDHAVTDDEARAGQQKLLNYVLARVRIMGNGKARCATKKAQVTVGGNDEPRVTLSFVARCPVPLETVTVSYDLFFDLDPRHTGFLQAVHDGKSVIYEFTNQERSFVWRASGAPAGARLGLGGFVQKGMEHIFFGADHVAFVLGLLLIAAILYRPALGDPDDRSRGGTWESRPWRVAALYVLRVITAFTIAHSITLIAAALDWIRLPSALVESAIAASVVYIAVENIFVKEPRFRWPFTFAFGLVHGLGFANMLRPALPPSGVVAPLLAFNVGVELGQLLIVLVTLPVLALAARRSAASYRQTIVVGGSGAIALMGLLWFIERAFGAAIF